MTTTMPADVLSQYCPSRATLSHVTSRWAVLVLMVLTTGVRRFSQLRKEISGISEKMLAQTLQTLVDDGFVIRTAFPTVPPHVEYALTDAGHEVSRHVLALARWVEGYHNQMENTK